jgi:glucose/mannose-6-phosphate isomerase
MEKLMLEFSSQLEEAFTIAQRYSFQHRVNSVSNIVFCGMGGSGIGGRIVGQWIENEVELPVTFIQNYDIPNWINANTLVIASSYSGDTEETLSAVKACLQRGAHVLCITSGGALSTWCAQHDLDCIHIPSGLPPRAALGYSLVQQLAVLVNFGLIQPTLLQQLEHSAEFLRKHQQEIQRMAKDTVSVVNDTNVVIYAEASFESVAIRGKQQFNENSKYLCRHHAIPEMNHNELLGWGGGDSSYSALFLFTAGMHRQNEKRFKLTHEIVSMKTNRIATVQAKGANRVEQSMYLIHFLDWLSLYLGYERGQDIVQIDNINYLKQELAKW